MNNPVSFTVARSDLLLRLRGVAGGVTMFRDGKSRLYFAVRAKQDIEKKLTGLLGAPVSNKPTESVWWSETLQLHVKVVTGRNDVCVTIPTVGGEVKGAFQ